MVTRQPAPATSMDRDPWSRAPIYDDAGNGPTWSTMMEDAVVDSAVDELITQALRDPIEYELTPPDPILLQQIEDMDTEQLWRDALAALWRGFSLHLVTWSLRAGRYNLNPPTHVDPDLVGLKLDVAMRPVAVRIDRPGADPVTVSPPSYWLHRHNAAGTHPAGRSRLNAALRPYNQRDSLLKTWGRATRRNGLPLPVVTYPSGFSPAQIDELRTACEDLDSEAGLLLPDTVSAELIAPTYAATISIAEALHYADAMIRYRILLNWSSGTVMGRDTVYNAAAEIRARPQDTLLQLIRRELAQSVSTDLLTPLHRANWGPDARARMIMPEPAEPGAAPSSTTDKEKQTDAGP